MFLCFDSFYKQGREIRYSQTPFSIHWANFCMTVGKIYAIAVMLPTENSYTALCNILQIFFSNIAFLETPRDIKNHIPTNYSRWFSYSLFFLSFSFFFFLASFLSVDDKSNLKLCLVTTCCSVTGLLLSFNVFQDFSDGIYLCLCLTVAVVQCLKIGMQWPDQFQLSRLMTVNKLATPL